MSDIPPDAPPPSNIYDLKSFRDGRDGPDAEHIRVVFENGEAIHYYEFTCSYTTLDLREWGFTLWATDAVDAAARLKAISVNGRVDGQLFTSGYIGP